MDIKKLAEDSEITPDVPSSEWKYYTTTFNIPYWVGQHLKKIADEKGLDGMNKVVENSCFNYFFRAEKRRKHNEKLMELHGNNRISEKELKQLWLH